MLTKMAITQVLRALYEKFFRLNDPQNALYQENVAILHLSKGPDGKG